VTYSTGGVGSIAGSGANCALANSGNGAAGTSHTPCAGVVIIAYPS
jgi:hypothetical protein